MSERMRGHLTVIDGGKSLQDEITPEDMKKAEKLRSDVAKIAKFLNQQAAANLRSAKERRESIVALDKVDA